MKLLVTMEIEAVDGADAVDVERYKADLENATARYPFVRSVTSPRIYAEQLGEVAQKQAQIRDLAERRRAAISGGLRKTRAPEVKP